MQNISDRSSGENQHTHFMFKNIFSKNCAIYEIMWKNTVAQKKKQMTIWHMRTAWWIIKATNTHSKYIVLIAFPGQQQLRELYRHTVHTHTVPYTIWFMKIQYRLLLQFSHNSPLFGCPNLHYLQVAVKMIIPIFGVPPLDSSDKISLYQQTLRTV
jgi:hypothetical protein